MKPRIFIGSSVEGLRVASAIQQNLQYDLECTVWDQGVFAISSTTIESLVSILSTSDFGAFVFSPDDISKIRGTEHPTVRDNVIFELGLFIGALGRQRSFIFLPDHPKEIHLPTDLLGITISRYDAKRSDSNFRAATGPGCAEIKDLAVKLGGVPNNSVPLGTEQPAKNEATKIQEVPPSEQSSPECPDQKENPETQPNYLVAFENGEVSKASELISTAIKEAVNSDKRIELELLKAYFLSSSKPEDGMQHLDNLRKEHPSDVRIPTGIAFLYSSRNDYTKALNVLHEAFDTVTDKPGIVIAKADILRRMGNLEGAIALLEESIASGLISSKLYLDLAKLYKSANDSAKAIHTLHKGLREYPADEHLMDSLGITLPDTAENAPINVYLYRHLTIEYSKNPDYHCRLGNAYLLLDLNSMAFSSYETANQLAEAKAGWILANMGNMLNNRGLHHAAREYLNKALSFNPNDPYTLDRLASAAKSINEESKSADQAYRAGRKAFFAATQPQPITEAPARNEQVSAASAPAIERTDILR